jgi:hypothetical protein
MLKVVFQLKPAPHGGVEQASTLVHGLADVYLPSRSRRWLEMSWLEDLVLSDSVIVSQVEPGTVQMLSSVPSSTPSAASA